MKTKIAKLMAIGAVLLSVTLVACAQDKDSKSANASVEKVAPQKEATLEMDKDTLDAKVLAEIEKEVLKRKATLTKEALETIGKTEFLLKDVVAGKKDDAIKKGKELIADLEVLLTKDPTLALVPVDVSYQKEELVSDIETVRDAVKLAEKAMKKGYYREASDILKDIRSEMVISTYFIPAGTYPDAIKAAVVLLEEDDVESAKALLAQVLSTIVVEKTVEPIPVLNAEQMIIEAALIDAKDHENVDQVLNLLKNADYQLQLAQEMGYGKKDKDFEVLSDAIKELKKSVEKKEDSQGKFTALKQKLKSFRERLFSKKAKENNQS